MGRPVLETPEDGTPAFEGFKPIGCNNSLFQHSSTYILEGVLILYSIYVPYNYAVYLYVRLSKSANPIRLLTRIKTPCNRDDLHCGTTQKLWLIWNFFSTIS